MFCRRTHHFPANVGATCEANVLKGEGGQCLTDVRSTKNDTCHVGSEGHFNNGRNHFGRFWGVFRRLQHHPVPRRNGADEGSKGQDGWKVPWCNDQHLSFRFWQHMGSGSKHGKRGARGFGRHPSSQVLSCMHDLGLQRIDFLKVNFFTRLAHVGLQGSNQLGFMLQHGLPKRIEHRTSLGGGQVGSCSSFLLIEDVLNVFHEAPT